jgi:outer membrane immunogenic protein
MSPCRRVAIFGGAMRKIITAIAGVAALSVAGSTGAQAADMPAKAPPAAVVGYTWNGLYVGGNVGGAWSSGWSGTQSFSPLAGNIPVTFDHHGSGAIAGGQIGYNWQPTRNWVLGIEADLQWSGLDGGTSFSPLPIGGPVVANSATMSRDLQWFGTVRGRLGYAWDRWMVYGTGGFAYGQVRYDSALVFTLVTYGPVSVRSIETGWTAGGGVEHAFLNDWSAKVEYLYVSLGGQSAVGIPTAPVPFTQVFDWNHTNFQLVRFALNKKIANW